MLYSNQYSSSIYMELISIIIPYYKKKEFIAETLNSIFNQTYKNYEIIIIYDDESLNDLKYLKELVKEKNNIKILINKKNNGAGTSRNYGISNAKGEFIAFLDADDYWQSEKLSTQLNYMINEKINFSHTSYYVINDNKKIISTRKSRNISNFRELLRSCDVGLSTVMVKKELLKNNLFPNITTKEDFILWLNILKTGEKLFSINEPLTFWRKSSNSLSSNNFQKIIDGYRVYRKYMKMNVLISLYYLLILSLNSLIK